MTLFNGLVFTGVISILMAHLRIGVLSAGLVPTRDEAVEIFADIASEQAVSFPVFPLFLITFLS